MTTSIIPDRLSILGDLFLCGGVGTLDLAAVEKRVCIMQAVDYISGGDQVHPSDRPQCASPVLTRYGITLNDRLDDTQRQALKPLIPLIVGTRDDGKDERRKQIATEALMGDWLPKWLRLANLEDLALKAEQAKHLTGYELTMSLRTIRDLTWEERKASRARLTEQIRARLAERGAVAVAVAATDAVAVAVAATATDAVAVAATATDAVAVAVAATDAVAVAVAVAATVAVAAAADADAVAAAAADAAAAAVAAAAADAAAAAVAAVAVAPGDPWGSTYNAVYKAVREHYETSDKFAEIRALRDSQISAGVDLFQRMITAEPAA